MASPERVTRVAIAVVVRHGQVLVGSRQAGQPLAGMAEFPGGKLQPGETPQEAARRECLEEAGVAIEVDRTIDERYHTYLHGRLQLTFLLCQPAVEVGDTGQPSPHAPFQWIDSQRLSELQFPPANEYVLQWLSQFRW